MKFKPFGSKYSFPKDVLTEDYPEFIKQPLSDWIVEVLRYCNFLDTTGFGDYKLSPGFYNRLQITLREIFPQELTKFLNFVLKDKDRTSNILALFLQNYTNAMHARLLDEILLTSGSAYEVENITEETKYKTGVFDLTRRVQEITKIESKTALTENELLEDAWGFCYSRNPDYEKVVSRTCDFLEGYLGNLYFPQDPKPQLKKFVHQLRDDSEKLAYKGSSIVDPPNLLTDLLENASDIRGQHTLGKGRKPTKEEAEFILHTTIYIWNLHQK